jgi:transcriptional regulator with XRE-family HTH domain
MSTVITKEVAKQNLAANVVRLLNLRGFSQKQLSTITGEDMMTVSRICRGLVMPSADVVHRIAAAFEVDMGRLLDEPPTAAENKSRHSA